LGIPFGAQTPHKGEFWVKGGRFEALLALFNSLFWGFWGPEKDFVKKEPLGCKRIYPPYQEALQVARERIKL